MIPPTTPRNSDFSAWAIVGAMTVTCLLACLGLGFRVDLSGLIVPGTGLAILIAGVRIGTVCRRPRLAAGATAFLQMTVFTLVGVILSYALAARAGALWDGSFAIWDRTLGLDWPLILTAADRFPALLWVGGVAYHSLTVQMIASIVLLSATGQIDRLRVAVTAAIASGFATIAISGVMPAMGNLFDPGDYQHLWPSVAWMEHDLITGLRDGSRKVLDLTQLWGIVSFPSYHATLPLLLAWAQRDLPRWRYIAAIWAALTIAATPLFGGHYGVDVLAGMALAPIALAVARWMVPGLRQTETCSNVELTSFNVGWKRTWLTDPCVCRRREREPGVHDALV